MKKPAATWILAVTLAAGALLAAGSVLFPSAPSLLPVPLPGGERGDVVVVEAAPSADDRGGTEEPAGPEPEPAPGAVAISDVVPSPEPGEPPLEQPSLGAANGYVADGRPALALGWIGLRGLDAVIERRLAVLAGGECGPFGPWVETSSSAKLPPGSCGLYRVLVEGVVVFAPPEPVRYDGSDPVVDGIELVEDGAREFWTGSALWVAAGAESLKPVTVSVRASDPESGLRDARFRSGETVSEVPGAPWTAQIVPSPGAVVATVTNRAGDSASASVAVLADGQGPTGVSLSYPALADAGAPVEIAVVPGVDDGAGLDPASVAIERRIALRSEAGCGAFGEWTTSGATDTAREGTCAQYRVRVSDNVLNETVVRSETILEVPDATAPVTAITAPAAGSELEGTVTVTAEAADKGTGIRSVTIEAARHGGEWSALGTFSAGPYAVEWNTLLVEPGTYLLRSTAVDRAGNVAVSDVVEVVVAADDSAPETAILAPGYGSAVTGIVDVVAEATDEGSGVASLTVQVSADGSSWTDLGSSTGGDLVATWDTTGLEPGRYKLRSVAVDRRGNEGVSAVVKVVLEPPAEEEPEAPEPPDEEEPGEVEPPEDPAEEPGEVEEPEPPAEEPAEPAEEPEEPVVEEEPPADDPPADDTEDDDERDDDEDDEDDEDD